MRRRVVLVALALGLCVSSRPSEAASLALASTWHFTFTVGVFASDGSSPIPFPSIPPSYPDPVPATEGLAGGTMSLDLVGGQEADLSFSLSMFSDGQPYVATGSYGSAGVPVTLRIDELRYEAPPTRVTLGSGTVTGSSSGSLRGSLTVGASTVPFTVFTDGPWYSDAAPSGAMFADVSLDRVRFGYFDGFIVSGLGPFGTTPVMTLDGVTFSVGAIPEFWTIEYVPEPSSTALLAAAGSCLLWLGARRRSRA
jgi:hypothetical protein